MDDNADKNDKPFMAEPILAEPIPTEPIPTEPIEALPQPEADPTPILEAEEVSPVEELLPEKPQALIEISKEKEEAEPERPTHMSPIEIQHPSQPEPKAQEPKNREPITDSAAENCPWEHEKGLGWLANWWKSFVALASSPVSFLAHAHPTSGVGRAIGFGLTTALFSHLLAGPKRYLNFTESAPAREQFAEMMSQFEWGEALQPLFTHLPGFWDTEWAALFGLPFSFCFGLLSVGLLLQAPIWLFGGRGGLLATIKALCFSTPAMALAMFPWVGGTLAWAGQCVLFAVGIQVFHRLSTPRLAMIFLFWPLFGLFYLQSLIYLIIASINY